MESFLYISGLTSAHVTSGMIVAIAVLLLGALDIVQRYEHKPTHLLFAVITGTALSTVLLAIGQTISIESWRENAYAMALLVVCIWLAWKSLFGPWDAQTKATMLGTFLFWIGLRMLLRDDPDARFARLIAMFVAIVPAMIWCRLFLQYHKERFSNVLVAFFAGMLSTAPVLFYDALVTRNIELQFLLFKVVPESFHRTTESFVTAALSPQSGQNMLIISFVSFVLVGVLEETSKYWVLKKTARDLCTSIDDVLQLSIVVAIGFAFAENIINPTYFTGFVRQYLLAEQTDVLGFMSNVLGRSVLTTMVHIVSTGILGYFLGIAFYADSYVAERKRWNPFVFIVRMVHKALRIPETNILRSEAIFTGFTLAIISHGCFNFLVTLPDLLPGDPQSLGEVLGLSNQILQHIPFLLIPALLYVVGGFWLLTALFMRTDSMQERGHVVGANPLDS